MNVSILLEMAADAMADRVAVGSRSAGLSYGQLLERAGSTAAWLKEQPGRHVGLVDRNSEAVPILLFGAAIARRSLVPVNYRLADEQLRSIVARIAPAPVVVDHGVRTRLEGIDAVTVIDRAELLDGLPPAGVEQPDGSDPDDVAVMLFTSGTSGEPKAAVLRHRHLVSYVIGIVEFAAAGDEEAALVSVPPYHIAGISAVLSSVFGGRRLVYLPQFDPDAWVELARDEAVTHAMVVPTMLGRILEVLERGGERLPALRQLSYGGGRMPVPVVERALELLPTVGFVNAYGLTETSSTISILTPEDHREAIAGTEPGVRHRLASVGRPVHTIEVEIRDEEGRPVQPGGRGEIHVRGDQVAGEYLDRSALSSDGWFATKDAGSFDADGFLYVEGRLDDVIVRGGENLSPGTIEDSLVAHHAVSEACVVGVPDTEWGEAVVAAVVLTSGDEPSAEELQAWVRSRLRSSHVPVRVERFESLPYTDTGKLLRRVVKQLVEARD